MRSPAHCLMPSHLVMCRMIGPSLALLMMEVCCGGINGSKWLSKAVMDSIIGFMEISISVRVLQVFRSLMPMLIF